MRASPTLLIALGAVILCAIVNAESVPPLSKTRDGTRKRHQFIKPLPPRKQQPPVKESSESDDADDADQQNTTYDWGQHTGSSFDWGKYTSTAAPNQNSTGAQNGTTIYDWGQHTGSTFDWGKYTSTKAPNQNSTGAQNGTTYDWGQHTGSTFDWGKYTSTKAPNQNSTGAQNGTTYDWGKWTSTAAPNQNTTGGQNTGTTYNWGQHTGSTYDWGQHTKPTQAPNQNGTDNGNNGNHNGTDQNSRCGAGSYSCAGAIGLCLNLKQVCNGKIDCPMADDEDPRICYPNLVAPATYKNVNRFRGQGFMYSIKNLVVRGGSQAKLWNQNSDRHIQKSG